MAKKKLSNLDALKQAAKVADWKQVGLSGGSPCFYLDGDSFCLRSHRWAGHVVTGFHSYVPLEEFIDMVAEAMPNAQR